MPNNSRENRSNRQKSNEKTRKYRTQNKKRKTGKRAKAKKVDDSTKMYKPVENKKAKKVKKEKKHPKLRMAIKIMLVIFLLLCVIGAGIIAALFIFLIWRCLITANSAPDIPGALLTMGVTAHLGLQMLINIAVVTNSIPNTGIPLPFISYGGSSVMTTMIMFFIIQGIYIRLQKEGERRSGRK